MADRNLERNKKNHDGKASDHLPIHTSGEGKKTTTTKQEKANGTHTNTLQIQVQYEPAVSHDTITSFPDNELSDHLVLIAAQWLTGELQREVKPPKRKTLMWVR